MFSKFEFVSTSFFKMFDENGLDYSFLYDIPLEGVDDEMYSGNFSFPHSHELQPVDYAHEPIDLPLVIEQDYSEKTGALPTFPYNIWKHDFDQPTVPPPITRSSALSFSFPPPPPPPTFEQEMRCEERLDEDVATTSQSMPTAILPEQRSFPRITVLWHCPICKPPLCQQKVFSNQNAAYKHVKERQHERSVCEQVAKFFAGKCVCLSSRVRASMRFETSMLLQH